MGSIQRRVYNMFFETIILKDISWSILCFLRGKAPMRPSEISEGVGLTERQINAAVTKSLVRYGFAARDAKKTRLMKKDYNLIRITPLGEQYLDWHKDRDR